MSVATRDNVNTRLGTEEIISRAIGIMGRGSIYNYTYSKLLEEMAVLGFEWEKMTKDEIEAIAMSILRVMRASVRESLKILLNKDKEVEES